MHRNVYDRILLLSQPVVCVPTPSPLPWIFTLWRFTGDWKFKAFRLKKSQEVRKPKLCHPCGITEGFKGEDLKQKESTVGMVWIVSGVDSFSYQLTYGKVPLNFFFSCC